MVRTQLIGQKSDIERLHIERPDDPEPPADPRRDERTRQLHHAAWLVST